MGNRYPSKADHAGSTTAFKTCACGGRLKCIDSRTGKEGDCAYVRRRYQCASCRNRVTTGEFLLHEGEGAAYRKHVKAFLKAKRAQGADALRSQMIELLGLSKGERDVNG
jgi:transcriptional regulator NrdR family protein